MNSNEMIEVRIAYKFHVEARTRSARNSEGTYNYVESDEYCDGLHTNIENIFFNLQDYEIFIGIEKNIVLKNMIIQVRGQFIIFMIKKTVILIMIIIGLITDLFMN